LQVMTLRSREIGFRISPVRVIISHVVDHIVR
jgi:hypothetical protein